MNDKDFVLRCIQLVTTVVNLGLLIGRYLTEAARGVTSVPALIRDPEVRQQLWIQAALLALVGVILAIYPIARPIADDFRENAERQRTIAFGFALTTISCAFLIAGSLILFA